MINLPLSKELVERVQSLRLNVAQQIPGRKDNYLFECYYESDVDEFIDLLQKKGGIFLAVLKVPGWNSRGEMSGSDYVVVYQHIHELEMMIKC